jgi:hypothetical protein
MQCIRHHVVQYHRRHLLHVPRQLPLELATKRNATSYLSRRSFTDIIPAVLIPPVVFSGLVVTLWTWKCFMMVLFQNRIIYMPGLPPNARRERISDYASQCAGITWREERTTSSDGTEIGLCVAEVESSVQAISNGNQQTVYILYFQGLAFHISNLFTTLI